MLGDGFMKSESKSTKRLTIGILISYFDGLYQYQIWKSITDYAEENGINIVFLTGKIYNSPNEFDNQFNIVYKLADLKVFDGIVVASGTIAVLSGMVELDRLIKPFNKIPAVSLSMPIAGIPSLLIDNKKGMKEAVRHLIDVHGRRKIAFIRGPENNFEAEERFDAYREALSECNIRFDPDLVITGDFTNPSGKKCTEILLKERNADFNAIVASNDMMADAAINVLKSNGIKVPDDVSITGFDDMAQSQYLTPPLTTVAQPLNDQSFLAMKLLIDKINGKPVPGITHLKAGLVIRESCGCKKFTGHDFRISRKS